MRQNLGRLTSAGIAIVLGTAFVAATLLAGQVLTKSSESSITAQYADADLVVSASIQPDPNDPESNWDYKPLQQDTLDQIRNVDGVADVAFATGGSAVLSSGSKSEYIMATQTTSSDRLRNYEIVEGSEPASPTEIAVPAKLAERLGKGIGDTISADFYANPDDPTTDIDFTISGFAEDFRGGYSQSGGLAVFTPEGISSLINATTTEEFTSNTGGDAALVLLDPSISVGSAQYDQVIADIQKVSDNRPVQSTAEITAEQLERLSGDSAVITNMVLAFALLALLVASLVISNTFQVLVAQRTKTLALLRCVGASKKQIRSSVVTEALILGFVSSVIGIISGIVLVQIVLWVLKVIEASPAIPTTVSIPASAIYLPLIAGIITTLIASFVPARIATQVAPLAALRPIEGTADVRKTSLARIIISALLVAGGVAAFVFAFSLDSDQAGAALAIGILGGALSFIGLIISSVLWVPAVVAAIGSVFSKFGASAQIATANIKRNPRRTASTATALFIGVTLVSLLSVGASTARSTLDNVLDSQFPLDVVVNSQDGTPLSPELIQQIKNLDGVETAAGVNSTTAAIVFKAPGESTYTSEPVRILEYSDSVKATLRDLESISKLSDKTALVSTYGYPPSALKEINFVPSTIDATELSEIEQDSQWKNRVVLESAGTSGVDGFVVTTNAFEQMTANFGSEIDDPQVSDIFVRVSDPSNASDTVDEINSLISESSAKLSGSVLERQMFQQVINAMLLVLIGLLGVAVVIALVGVANTLSLSVIERRRESATLRAVGMSRRQLRTSLALEGMLIAGIGALVGVILGVIYGALGSELVLGGLTDVVLTVRAIDIVLIFAVALIAGFLASIVPGRAAAKTSPVAALAVD